MCGFIFLANKTSCFDKGTIILYICKSMNVSCNGYQRGSGKTDCYQLPNRVPAELKKCQRKTWFFQCFVNYSVIIRAGARVTTSPFIKVDPLLTDHFISYAGEYLQPCVAHLWLKHGSTFKKIGNCFYFEPLKIT